MTNRFSPARLFLYALVLIGVVAGARGGLIRADVEKANRRVEIAVDYNELRLLAAGDGRPIADVLKQFKDAGINSVTLQEETISSLAEAGYISPFNGNRKEVRLYETSPTGEPGIPTPHMSRIIEALHTKTHAKVQMKPSGAVSLPLLSTSIVIDQPYSLVRSVGVGLDPETVTEVKQAGLGIVGRVSNYHGVESKGIVWTLAELKKQGVSTVMFSGDELLGFKGYLVDDKEKPELISTVATMKQLGLFYGAVEFGKQKGDMQLTKAAPEQVVRVHTVTGAEMLTADVPNNVQRFALAARERNIRLLFVRLFLDEPDPVGFNTQYIGKIVARLKAGGIETGQAHGYGFLGTGIVPHLLMGLAVAAGFVLLLDAITGVLRGNAGLLPLLITVLGALVCAAAPALPMSIGQKAGAFAAACIFPTLAMVTVIPSPPSPLSRKRARGGEPINETPLIPLAGEGQGVRVSHPLLQFLLACAITFLGIALVVGLLADRAYLVKADVFAGIKIALVVPLLVTALVSVLDLRATESRSWSETVKQAKEQIVAVSGQPILVWQVVAGAVALAALALIVVRSGNDAPAAVSGFELKIRSILDRLLVARPRFKSMFGHPALVIALLLVASKRYKLAIPLFIIGAMAQADLLNTFCHLHTPLPVSLWRALLGIGIGAIIGLVVYALLNALVLKRLPAPETSH